jgi:hypothetical protein
MTDLVYLTRYRSCFAGRARFCEPTLRTLRYVSGLPPLPSLCTFGYPKPEAGVQKLEASHEIEKKTQDISSRKAFRTPALDFVEFSPFLGVVPPAPRTEPVPHQSYSHELRLGMLIIILHA